MSDSPYRENTTDQPLRIAEESLNVSEKALKKVNTLLGTVDLLDEKVATLHRRFSLLAVAFVVTLAATGGIVIVALASLPEEVRVEVQTKEVEVPNTCKDHILKSGGTFEEWECHFAAQDLQHEHGQWVCRCPRDKAAP